MVKWEHPASGSYRGVLALDAGAVEADRGDALNLALDVEDALVVLLSRLRLREVACPQSDWPDYASRYQDVTSGEDLWTALKTKKKKEKMRE